MDFRHVVRSTVAVLVLGLFALCGVASIAHAQDQSGQQTLSQVDGNQVVVAQPAPDSDLQQAAQDALPAERGGDTLVAIALVMAAILRGAVSLLRSNALAGLWGKLALPVQWIVLSILGALLAFADTVVTGASWKTAIVTAVAGWFASWTAQKIQKTDRVVNPPAA